MSSYCSFCGKKIPKGSCCSNCLDDYLFGINLVGDIVGVETVSEELEEE